VSGANATSVVLQHVPVALENWLGVVAFWEIVSEPVPAAYWAAVLDAAVIVVFAGMPLPMMICPALGGVVKETFVTVLLPVVVVAPRLVSVTISAVFVDVALAEIVRDVGGLPVVLVT
jgi:ABC-type polysaccharide transport system permease subunit